jgi:hypothetical protein
MRAHELARPHHEARGGGQLARRRRGKQSFELRDDEEQHEEDDAERDDREHRRVCHRREDLAPLLVRLLEHSGRAGEGFAQLAVCFARLGHRGGKAVEDIRLGGERGRQWLALAHGHQHFAKPCAQVRLGDVFDRDGQRAVERKACLKEDAEFGKDVGYEAWVRFAATAASRCRARLRLGNLDRPHARFAHGRDSILAVRRFDLAGNGGPAGSKRPVLEGRHAAQSSLATRSTSSSAVRPSCALAMPSDRKARKPARRPASAMARVSARCRIRAANSRSMGRNSNTAMRPA